jgi:hypothetical protein
MPFLASNGVLGDIHQLASKRALHTKGIAQQRRATLAAGNVTSSFVISIDADVMAIRTEMQGYAATPGIGPYVQANTPGAPAGYDAVAEWQTMIAALQAVSDEIRATFPVAAGGFLLARTWAAEREFTPAQTAGLRTQLDNLIATIS